MQVQSNPGPVQSHVTGNQNFGYSSKATSPLTSPVAAVNVFLAGYLNQLQEVVCNRNNLRQEMEVRLETNWLARDGGVVDEADGWS